MDMKVLHIFKRSLPDSIGGVENFIDTLCKSVYPYGVDNNVLSLTKKPSKNEIILNGYKVHQAKENINIGSTGFSIDALFKFHQLAKQADIIHHHYRQKSLLVPSQHVYKKPQELTTGVANAASHNSL